MILGKRLKNELDYRLEETLNTLDLNLEKINTQISSKLRSIIAQNTWFVVFDDIFPFDNIVNIIEWK